MDMARQIPHHEMQRSSKGRSYTPPREAEEGFLSGNQRLVDVRLRHIRALCGVYDLVALAFHGGGKLVIGQRAAVEKLLQKLHKNLL